MTRSVLLALSAVHGHGAGEPALVVVVGLLVCRLVGVLGLFLCGVRASFLNPSAEHERKHISKQQEKKKKKKRERR